MITLNNCQQGNENDYKGLSTDTKPTNCAVNSLSQPGQRLEVE